MYSPTLSEKGVLNSAARKRRPQNPFDFQVCRKQFPDHFCLHHDFGVAMIEDMHELRPSEQR